MDAVLTFQTAEVTARGGGTIRIPVRVVNRSRMPFAAGTGEAPFGLSYHLLSDDGRDVQFNNARSYFWEPLAPDEERIVHMAVDVPKVQGNYTGRSRHRLGRHYVAQGPGARHASSQTARDLDGRSER